jgi:hypothetical protein
MVMWAEWSLTRSPLITARTIDVPSGSLDQTDSAASGSPSASNPSSLPVIGQRSDLGAALHNGYIRDVVIVNAPTTQEQRERLTAWLLQR